MNSATSTDPGLRPWQLFLLAGMLAATGVVLVSTGQTLAGVVVLSLTVVASSLVAMAGYRSLAPLMTAPEAEDLPAEGRARAALEREKALVLRTIKELEFDHAMGKTATAEFEDMRQRLKLRAVGLMRRLDGANYRPAIEQALAARGSVPPAVPPAMADDGVLATGGGLRRCAACQSLNDVDARFCKQCGVAFGAVAV